jgi:hypothetical protein
VLTYKPGPTGNRFLNSRKFIKLICGPVGGGKSTVAAFDLFRRSCSQAPWDNVRRTKFIVLRNTMQQLKATVKPLINQWFVDAVQGRLGEWRLTDNVFHMHFRMPDGTIVDSEWWLMAADTPDDVRRLLSVEASAAWVEEAREVDPEVFSGLQGRVARYPNRAMGGVTEPGVICSTNPPPLGGFWHELMTRPPANTEIFMQPPALLEDGQINRGQVDGIAPAENLEHLDPAYYDNLVEGKPSEWIDVYLKNKYGSGGFGQPVFRSSFKMSFHKSAEPLQAVVQTLNPLVIGMDNGLTAAAVLGQMDARGRVNILDECYVPEGETMGVETFLDRHLIPKLRNEWPFRSSSIVFVLDPACFQRSQLTEMTIAQAIQVRGYQVVKAVTNDPERRISAVEGLLNRQVDGGPVMRFSPKVPWLLEALDWGYRYKKMASGQASLVPEKNHWSHIADALQYLALHYNQQVDPGMMHLRPRARPVVPRKYVYA